MSKVRSIALYLPQFHPIAENDAWWGKGFTEWTNVTKARPVVPGHYQPHLPADLGFYDLRVPEVREMQAALAAKFGISGFCYYHYWFNGRQVLERPVAEILASGRPDFPFCLCWANENWTRAWDGRSREVLLAQNYSAEDDARHITHLLKYFEDKRYIRVDGRPLFLVYRTELIPDPRRTAEIWRQAALRSGLGEIFLARVESFEAGIDPGSIGFDAAVEFAPDWRRSRHIIFSRWQRLLSLIGVVHSGYFRHRFCDYETMVNAMKQKPVPPYRYFRCITPGFDNSPRRSSEATIFLGSSPELFGEWAKSVVHECVRTCPDDPLFFVNAWNEWGEGNHLEPDRRHGTAYLQALSSALASR